MSEGNLWALVGLILIGISVIAAVILEIYAIIRKKMIKRLLHKEYQ